MKFTFHVLGFPHTKISKEHSHCAYSMKIYKFVQMMRSLGHKVFVYAPGGDVECEELVQVESDEDYRAIEDWRTDFSNIKWELDNPVWKKMSDNIIAELPKRIQPKDFIITFAGYMHKEIADAYPMNMTVEAGIGYHAVFSKYRVFESYAWMHYIYGRTGVENGSYYDCVIPNYWDPTEFYIGEKQDYFLYIGRVIHRKGVGIASDLANAMGSKLIVAGQGVIHSEPGLIEAKEITLKGDHVHYFGTANVEERAELMANARAVLVPTSYIGPFEGVSIEAMFSGTPVITTDWGCFAETVVQGITGFRCRTWNEFIAAAANVHLLDPKTIRHYAINNYSMDSVRYKYQSYFEQLYDLWSKGWYELSGEPHLERYRTSVFKV